MANMSMNMQEVSGGSAVIELSLRPEALRP
jgi:hypothetical protein